MWIAGNNKNWLGISFLCLLAGTVIYVCCRPLPWMPRLGTLTAMPDWFLYHLPDGLWAAAFAAALLGIVATGKAAWAIWSPAAYVLLIEGLQGAGFWPGTADILDVIWSMGGCAFILGLYAIQTLWKIREEKQLTCS